MTDTKQPESHTTLYDVCQEVLRLESVNAELLEALKDVLPILESMLRINGDPSPDSIGGRARAAIAKAEGESK